MSAQSPASAELEEPTFCPLPNNDVIVVEEIVVEPIPISTAESIENKLNAVASQVEPVIQGTITVIETEPVNAGTQLEPREWLYRAYQGWQTCDSDIAFHITEFKRKYIFPIGDVPVRSVLMAVSTGLTYAVFGRINPSMLGRARNLGLNFVLNGSFWLPELFNPFLFLQNRN